MYHWLVPRLVFPAAELLGGRRVRSELSRLREIQWLPAPRVEALAVDRLRSLVAHATAHVPYYRDLFGRAGVGAGDIRSVSDLSRFPITTKTDLRSAFPVASTADDLPAQRRRPMVTSGSSGRPLEFYWDRSAADELLGSYLFSLEWAGAAIWQTRLVVASPAYFYTNSVPSSRWRRRLRRVALGEHSVSLAANQVSVAGLREIVARLRGRREYFIRGYPSALADLAGELVRTPEPLPSYPRAVIAFAENVTPPNAAIIREAFRCRVTNYYTSWEVPQMAQTCPDNPDLLHVNSRRVVLRIVRDDGTDAKPGEPGRVVVTDLANRVMPFINYLVDDHAVGGAACPCGRGLPTLAAVDGRSLERITTPRGDRVSGGMLGQFLVSVVGVLPYALEYQAEQTGPGAVTLRIVPTERYTLEFGRSLRGQVETFLGPDMSVALDVVSRIPVERSGKRLIIRPLEPGHRE